VTNNYILRRLRYTFNYSDSKMIAFWAAADCVVTREQVSQWLKKEEDPDYLNCSDKMLATFLNGLINGLRGKKDGPQMEPESRINNNIILRKLKIALNLRNDDVCELMDLGGLAVGKSELSAFFRKVGHKHYRVLQDQMLRKFIHGLQDKHRGKIDTEDESSPVVENETSINKAEPVKKTAAVKKEAAVRTERPAKKLSKEPQQPSVSPEEESSEGVNSDIWNKTKKS